MKKVSLLLLVCFLTSNSNLALATSPIPSPEQQKALEIQRLKSEFNSSKKNFEDLIKVLGKMQKFERARRVRNVTVEEPLRFWHLQGPQEENGYEGINANAVHDHLNLNTEKSGMAIVAVLDGGINVNHEALKDYVLINEKEIPNNNIDDDKNGYVDDIHGWDFVGKDVVYDSLELTRQYFRCKTQKVNAAFCKKIKADYTFQVTHFQKAFKALANEEKKITTLQENLEIAIGEEYFDKTLKQIGNARAYFEDKFDKSYSSRYIQKQTPGYVKGGVYGSNDVIGWDADHGTHVTGDVVLTFEKAFGGKEKALQHLRFIPVRVVPDGDERDEDVANAIRYAVDRGANIIQMSFGKSYAGDEDKDLVDAAVQYGHTKGVVFVHASGNDGHHSTPDNNFPNARVRKTNTILPNWIDVGNSTPIGETNTETGQTIAAQSSNYGSYVNIFAPGTEIYSTISTFDKEQAPEKQRGQNTAYGYMDGTSMAAPIFSGSLAVLLAAFPQEKTADLAQALIRNGRNNRANEPVLFYEELHEYTQIKKGSRYVKGKDYNIERIPFKDASTSGNVLDLYQAVCKIGKISGC